MSDLFGNPNCWFSHAQAHFISLQLGARQYKATSRSYSVISHVEIYKAFPLASLGINIDCTDKN